MMSISEKMGGLGGGDSFEQLYIKYSRQPEGMLNVRQNNERAAAPAGVPLGSSLRSWAVTGASMHRDVQLLYSLDNKYRK
jgi:hypothetical protein